MEENNIELNNKREEYTRYIGEHRVLVKKALQQFLKIKNIQLSEEEIKTLSEEIANHDLSKYGEEEFESYRKHFFPCSFENKKESDEEFRIAVQHHYSVNNHHPQHPSRRTGLNKIACIHNILDWIAMSYKFNDNIWDFYSRSKISEKINPIEREYIEDLLGKLKSYKDIIYSEEKEK